MLGGWPFQGDACFFRVGGCWEVWEVLEKQLKVNKQKVHEQMHISNLLIFLMVNIMAVDEGNELWNLFNFLIVVTKYRNFGGGFITVWFFLGSF